MPRILLANNVSSTLAVALTASTSNTTLTVATGQGALFPNPTGGDFFLLTLTAAGTAASEVPWQWGATMYYEIVKVTARSGDVLTVVRAYEAPTGQPPDGGQIAGVAAWGIGSKADMRLTSGALRELELTTPANITPAQGATNQLQRPLMECSIPGLNFGKRTPAVGVGVAYGATKIEPCNLTLQLSTTQNFATIYLQLTGQSALIKGVANADVWATSIRDNLGTLSAYLPGSQGGSGAMAANTSYWWRVRIVSAGGHSSGWSTPTSFTTAAAFPSYSIATPAATPAIGAAFEGGYYAGLIWQLADNNFPVQQGFGNFNATPSQVSVGQNQSYPTHYVGQTLVGQAGGTQTRSARTQYWQKYTVAANTAFQGTSMTVTSVQNSSLSGSGTANIMARFRIIVAPKATGETTLAMKNDGLKMALAGGYGSATSGPNANNSASSNTVANGQKATEAMYRATSPSTRAASYPAANWARNLSIGGYTDWYIPGRDELELMYRNLRPSTTNNAIVQRSGPSVSDLIDLSSGGAHGDIGDTTSTAQANGINANSEPVGAAYTATVPARTAVALFQTGGAQALAASIHWSSSPCWDSQNNDYDSGASGTWFSHRNWVQNMADGQQGYRYYQASQGGAINTATVRAVRRSVI